MKVLGIETSCDETSAAVVENGCRLLSNIVASSMDLHVMYGGVVPEIAARSHIESINAVIDSAMAAAGCTWNEIDAVAVTYGPGLGGSLLIGVLAARTLAIVHNKPLYAINHVAAHVYSNFLTETAGLPPGHVAPVPALDQLAPPVSSYQLPPCQPSFPLLALIVSGGHSQLVLFQGHFEYVLLGQTHDDAVGEAFDKVAKILGLPYPGGPSIGRKAREGNPRAYHLPKAAMTHVSPALQALRSNTALVSGTHETAKQRGSAAGRPRGSYDFSFSGLKTAVLRLAQELTGHDHTFPSKNLPEALNDAQKADIAASFERVAIETVVDKTVQAYMEFAPQSVVIAGGVAASPELRRQLSERLPCPINYTDPKLCTDNGAMIATLGCFHVKTGQPTADPYTLDSAPNLSM